MGRKVQLVSGLVLIVAIYFGGKYYKFFEPPLRKSPVVTLPVLGGKLQGKISVSRDGKDFYEYLGLPYAQPPLGELRYELPKPLEKKWPGVRDATSYAPVCIQVDLFTRTTTGREDCLYLNVHSPTLNPSSGLSVLVWFHGGLFAFGTGNTYRPEYFMDENIVLVTVGYRLASFGFLNTGDGVIRGNMGLKDQNAALQWVRDNILAFGGNPKDVTIFGESAGGASVHYQMLSPMSKGLFHKAIAQSGLATMPWALNPTPAAQAKRFAAQVDCPTSNTKEMVDCLKAIDAMTLVQIHEEVNDNLRPLIAVFLPTVEVEIGDGATFLSRRPTELIESGEYNDVPLLAGLNSGEGLLVSAPTVANRTITSLLSTSWDRTLPPLLFLPAGVSKDIPPKIKSFYLSNSPVNLENPLEQMENLTNIFSDWVWSLGFHNGITAHVNSPKKSDIYLYYFTFEGEFTLTDVLLSLRGDYHPIIEVVKMKISNWFREKVLGETLKRWGSCHGDELAMQFPITGVTSVKKGVEESRDYKFSKEVTRIWADFAKGGGKDLKFLGVKWPPQEAKKPLRYMKMNTEEIGMIDEPFADRLKFWKPLKLLS